MLLLFELLALIAPISIFTTATHSPSYWLESSTIINGTIPVSKYKTKTGLKIYIAKTQGPLVNGYLCLATKTHDDNGIPHCLEHLTFFSSEDYPYKGELEMHMIRSYSAEMNAQTYIDRTCYTTSHIVKEGFLRFLPVFMDHILYPKLQPSIFITEIYHVNGEGLDGGVVFSEMEANNDFAGSYLGMRKELYKNSGYDSYTGGVPKNLRENTTYQMLEPYHKRFYRPENLCITICGDVTIAEVMTAIKKIEEKICSKPKLLKWEKPWLVPLPCLKTTLTKKLLPTNEDFLPQVYIAWRGPNCVTEYRKFLACRTLLSYLSSSATPEDTFGSKIHYGTEEAAESAVFLGFLDVPEEKLLSNYGRPTLRITIYLLILWVICGIFISEMVLRVGIEKLNIDQMKVIIASKLVTFLNELETSPHTTISDLIANDFLYGTTVKDFKTLLNIEHELQHLLTVPESYWINILKEYFVNKQYVQFVGIPSRAEQERLNKEEEDLIAKRINNLGPSGLDKKANDLAKAIELNSRRMPDSIIKSIPIPSASASDIKFHDVKIYRTGNTKDVPSGLDLNSWPIYAEVYDCRTNYVYITATFYTNEVGTILRPYLYLFLKLITESKIQRDVEELNDLKNFATVTTHIRIGVAKPKKSFSCGLFSQTASIMIQVEKTEYEIGIKYFIALLQSTVFDVDSIRSVALYLLNEIPRSMQNNVYSTLDLLRAMYYKSDTNVKTHSTMYQKKFLTLLLTMLDNGVTAQEVVDKLNSLRVKLMSNSNLAVHVTADFAELNKSNTDLNAVWKHLGASAGSKKLKIISDWEVMNAVPTGDGQGEVVGLASTESAYLYHTSPGIKDFNHDDLAALNVALNYLIQIGGLMWRRLRGRGYTYVYQIIPLPSEGLIQFSLYRASDVVRAFNETVNIINEVVQTNSFWEQTLVDSTKCMTISQIVNDMANFGDIPLQSLLLSFQNVSSDYQKDFISKVTAVTIDDLKRVAQLYFTKIFSTTESKTTIVCNKNEANEISNGLKKLGFNLTVKFSLEDSLIAKF